jgi:D-alanyl-D-alanine carboxypeptidase (penicillin-binding protein 5/6)
VAFLVALLGTTAAAPTEAQTAPAAGVPAAPSTVLPPGVDIVGFEPAEGWVLVDADTGAVLGAGDERTPRPPASTIKLLTALVATQRLAPDEAIPISALAEAMPARKINVKAGQVWALPDLLASMLLASANDAAVAVAEHVGGGDLAGWQLLAERTAEALGTEDAPVLADPSGLDDEFSHNGGSLISARDLAIVARAFLAEPRLAPLSMLDEYRFDGGDGLPHSVVNQNTFLDLRPEAIGLKTGFTERAGRTFVGAVRRDGRTMLIVLLDSPDIYFAAGALADAGFSVPIDAQGSLDVLPAVVAGAALDPPVRIAGALDTRTGVLVPGDVGGDDGLHWNDAPVVAVLALVGLTPLVVGRRRHAVRSAAASGALMRRPRAGRLAPRGR